MRRLLFSLTALSVAAACGGTPKQTQTAPLPEDTKQAAAPAEPPPPAPAPAPEPPKPAGPLEVKIPSVLTTVKLVSGGKGKKVALRYTPKAGTKQPVELAMDFTGKQDADEQTVPTIVLIGEAEAKAVDKDGTTEYAVTVTGTDAREVAGSAVPVDQFKKVLTTLTGLQIGGKLAANGASSEVTLRMEQPPEHAAEALDLIRLTLPSLPSLPTEPIGVGAKWQATTSAKLADRLDVTQVTDYELVAHKGSTWTIKGKTKVTGKDQQIDSSQVTGISGTGSVETTITDGALYPAHKASLETQFKAAEGDKSAQFVIKIGGAVTPKAP